MHQFLKGTTANESALLVRLNLLKGITAFYRRQWKVAEKHFNDVCINQFLETLIVSLSRLS